MAIYNSILDTIGRTPIVRLHRLPPKHVSLFVKVDSFNPGGSVKDRAALYIVRDAEVNGHCLVYHADRDQPAEKAAAHDALKSLGIIVR